MDTPKPGKIKAEVLKKAPAFVFACDKGEKQGK